MGVIKYLAKNFWLKYVSGKLWLKYGLIAVGICALLYFFYLFAYYPVLIEIYPDQMPDSTLILPGVTGHLFPLLSHFIIEGSSLTKTFCAQTEPFCYSWTREQVPDCVEWVTKETNAKGCCTGLSYEPKYSCVEKVEVVGTLLLVFILAVIYFGAGSFIGFVVQKKRKNNNKIRKT
ncbi:hypothetical protein HN587_03455 [Candidatus Woesearchaeota archaeon]|mgnify:CR=1 FL=1|jgi:hypothetical protein|nr:hypothetical protein [Candidatus Woesearchaeota archaeon]